MIKANSSIAKTGQLQLFRIFLVDQELAGLSLYGLPVDPMLASSHFPRPVLALSSHLLGTRIQLK
jgi:hypothetical protein